MAFKDMLQAQQLAALQPLQQRKNSTLRQLISNP